jgi:hypothetical protein
LLETLETFWRHWRRVGEQLENKWSSQCIVVPVMTFRYPHGGLPFRNSVIHGICSRFSRGSPGALVTPGRRGMCVSGRPWAGCVVMVTGLWFACDMVGRKRQVLLFSARDNIQRTNAVVLGCVGPIFGSSGQTHWTSTQWT